MRSWSHQVSVSDFIDAFPMTLSSSPEDGDPVDPLAFEEEVPNP